MNIKKEIELWDGKATDEIENIDHNHFHEASFAPSIVALITNPTTQKGDTEEPVRE